MLNGLRPGAAADSPLPVSEVFADCVSVEDANTERRVLRYKARCNPRLLQAVQALAAPDGALHLALQALARSRERFERTLETRGASVEPLVWERLAALAGIERGALLVGFDNSGRHLPFRLAYVRLCLGYGTVELDGPGVTKKGELSWSARRRAAVRDLRDLKVIDYAAGAIPEIPCAAPAIGRA